MESKIQKYVKRRKGFGFFREVPMNDLIAFLAIINSAFVFFALMKVYMSNLFYSLPYPENTFLSPPEGRFGDLYALNNSWQAFGFSGVGFGHAYFPGMYLILEIFHQTNVIFQWPGIWMLLIYLSLSILFYCVSNIQSPIMAFVAANLFLFSYPVLLIWSTGNVEAFIGMLLTLGAFAFRRGKWTIFAVIIGLAGSAKLFPIVFLLALFFVHKFKHALKLFLVGLVTSIVVSISAILLLRGGVFFSENNIEKIWANSQQSRSMYANLMYNSEGSIPFGHSFLNGIHSIFGMGFIETEKWALVIAILLSVFVFVPSLVFAWKKQVPTWQILSLLGAWTLTISPTSTDYRLVYLWPAILLLLSQKSANRSDMIVATYLVLILVPKPYFPTEIHPQATMNVYITSLMIVCLPAIIVGCNIILRKNANRSLVDKYAK